MSDGLSGQRRYSDDEFDRALRELTEGTGGDPRFREASAAERAEQARRQAKRTRRQARQQRRHGHPGRSRTRTTVVTSLVVILVLAASGAVVWFKSRHPSSTAVRPPAVAAAAPPADPFAGTPANTWADGAAGIVVPSALATGQFTVAQTAAAYQATKKLLIAGYLNEPTVLGGAPTAFADLLDRQQRAQFLSGLNKTGLSKSGEALSTRAWLTSFAPGSARLIGNAIKVTGMMSAATAPVSGVTALVVNVNYLFVYAVEQPGTAARWTRIVTHVRGQVQFASWDGPGTPLTLWDAAGTDVAGLQCNATDGYVHPDYPSQYEPDPVLAPNAKTVDPYSLIATLPAGSGNCVATTGT